MAGYGFARFNFRGRNALFLFVMSALLIPIAAFAVPLYLVYAKVHLDSTVPGIVIPFMISPVSVYLMRVYAGRVRPGRAGGRGPARWGRRVEDLRPGGRPAHGPGPGNGVPAQFRRRLEQLFPAVHHQ